jgi:uncharacterized protein DUF2877
VRSEGLAKETVPAVEACSIGGQAFDRIARADRQATVHSSYRGAVNVLTSRGLLSVVPEETGRGPLNINVVWRILGTHLPRPGSGVAVTAGGLAFEDGVVISLDNAHRYDPDWHFRASVLSPGQVERNVSASREIVLVAGHLAGLGGLLRGIERGNFRVEGDLNPFSAAAAPAVNSLMYAIRGDDRDGVGEAAKNLAGLGVGLTPSADDLLSGLMVGLVLGARNGMGIADASRLADQIVDSSAGRTSTLSFEFMRQAAYGRANEKIVGLVEAIYTEGTRMVARSTMDVITIGETSGTDYIAGVLLGVSAALSTQRTHS